MSKGKIVVKRASEYANMVRSIGIYIDNVKFDSLNNGETKVFELDPGIHEIYAKIDWCKTKPLIIDIRENDTAALELGSNATGWRMLLTFYYITLNTSEYLYLRNVGEIKAHI